MSSFVFRYLIPITLTGSIFYLLTLCLRPLAAKLSGRFMRGAVLLSAFLFVLPLPFLFFWANSRQSSEAPQTDKPSAFTDTLRTAPVTAPLYRAGEAINTVLPDENNYTEDNSDTTTVVAEKKIDIVKLISVIYVSGFVVATSIYVGQYILFIHRMKKSSRIVSEGYLFTTYQKTCQKLDVKSPPTLRVSANVKSPFSIGCTQQTIVLPPEGLHEQELKMAIAHEIGHTQKRDPLYKLFMQIVCSIHWFNPLVYVLRQDFAEACENACDESVSQRLSPVQRKDYAALLLEIASDTLPYPASGFSRNAKKLRNRLTRLLHPASKGIKITRTVAAFIICTGLCAALFVGCGVAAGASSVSTASNTGNSSTSILSLDNTSSLIFAYPFEMSEIPFAFRGNSEDKMLLEVEFSDMSDIPIAIISPFDGIISSVKELEDGKIEITVSDSISQEMVLRYFGEAYAEKGQKVAAKDTIGSLGLKEYTSNAKYTDKPSPLFIGMKIDGDPIILRYSNFATPTYRIADFTPPEANYMLWPVPYANASSRGYTDYHPALDINADIGVPILSSESGTVIIAGWDGAYGNYIVIDHGGDIKTLYAQCDTLSVQEGEYVVQGQVIATLGSSGNSTGPHLHFEVIVQGQKVDPLYYVVPNIPLSYAPDVPYVTDD